MKAILNSKNKDLNFLFNRIKINSAQIIKEIEENKIDQNIENTVNKEIEKEYKLYLEKSDGNGKWIKTKTLYDFSAFTYALNEYLSTGIEHRLIDNDNQIIEIFNSKYIED